MSQDSDFDDVSLDQAALADEREIQETDRAEDQAVLAEEKIAGRAGAIHGLRTEQKGVGDKPTIDRIRASGLCDLAPRYLAASYYLVALDSVCWFGSLTFLVAVTGLWRIALAILAVLCALMLSWVARIVLESTLRDVTSVARTIRFHRLALWRIGLVSGTGLATFLIFALLPSSLASWVIALAAVPILLCNLTLPLLAAVSRSLGQYLEKPARWDALERAIAIHRAAIRRLRRFVPKKDTSKDDDPPASGGSVARAVSVALLTLGLAGGAAAEVRAAGPERDACIDLVDVTVSGASDDQNTGRDFLASSALEQARAFHCRVIAVGAIGNGGQFAPRRWLQVAEPPDETRCASAVTSIPGERRLVALLRNVRVGVAEDCAREVQAARGQFETEAKELQRGVRDALAFAPAREWSRIRDAIQGAVDSPRARLVAALTDGIENPPGPIHVRIPEGVTVLLIITRPADPTRYAAVSEASRRWAAVPGVQVFSVGDLGPGFWAAVVGGR